MSLTSSPTTSLDVTHVEGFLRAMNILSHIKHFCKGRNISVQKFLDEIIHRSSVFGYDQERFFDAIRIAFPDPNATIGLNHSARLQLSIPEIVSKYRQDDLWRFRNTLSHAHSSSKCYVCGNDVIMVKIGGMNFCSSHIPIFARSDDMDSDDYELCYIDDEPDKPDEPDNSDSSYKPDNSDSSDSSDDLDFTDC